MATLTGTDLFDDITLTLIEGRRLIEDDGSVPSTIMQDRFNFLKSDQDVAHTFSVLTTDQKKVVQSVKQLKEMVTADIQKVVVQDVGYKAFSATTGTVTRNQKLSDTIALAYKRCQYYNSVETNVNKIPITSPNAFIDMFVAMFGLNSTYVTTAKRNLCLAQIEAGHEMIVSTT